MSSKLNLGKFLECLVKYKQDCERTVWTKRELHKFYFANLTFRRIQLKLQSEQVIYEICKLIEEKDFYFTDSETNILGIQFLKGSGKPEFTERLTPTDIKLFKYLEKYENLMEKDFEKRNISFMALSGWLGSILPYKFIPVTSRHFRHTISYLFDLELKIYQSSDYEYFRFAQEHFKLTKQKLKEFNLDSLFLKELAEYVKIKYSKSSPKDKYAEYDWNWITQDFHLYVYREILGMDSVERLSVPGEINPNSATPGLERPEILNIYVP